MPAPPLRVIDERFPGRPVFDTAITHALLRGVAAGELPATLRLYEPDDVVVFSQLDARRPRFAVAIEAADRAGCGSVMRLAGGHAALFHRRTLAFSFAIPDARAHDHIRERFEQLSELVARALLRLGVDARIGEVAGEYCPGQYSVNARGRRKLMGVGQRVVRGAAHVGGVIVVDDSARVRDVLVPVYRALDLDWRPETAGAIRDEIGPIGCEDVRAALLAELEALYALEPARFDASTRERADDLETSHRPDQRSRPPARDPIRALDAKTLAIDDG